MSWFYVAMQREPVVMWSCFIGFTGASPPNPASVVSLHSETLPIRKGFCSVRPIRPGGSPGVDERCIDCDRGSHVVSIVRTRERRHSRPVLPNPRSPPFELQLTMIISSSLSSPGVMLPVVVPPIRDAFSSGPKPKAPPSPHAVAKALTGK